MSLPPPTALRSKSRPKGFTTLAICTLARICGSKAAPAAAHVSAASGLLDRGWGSAPQSHVGEHGGDIRIVIRQISGDEEEPLLLEHEPPEK